MAKKDKSDVDEYMDCQRCGGPFNNGLLLNRRTKTQIKVVQICPGCCRDLVIGLHSRSKRGSKYGVPFGYILAFARHFQTET